MELTAKASSLSRYTFSPITSTPIYPHFFTCSRRLNFPLKLPPKSRPYSTKTTTFYPVPQILRSPVICSARVHSNSIVSHHKERKIASESLSNSKLENFGVLGKRVVVLAVLGYSVIKCQRALAMEGLAGKVYLKSIWPKVLQVLCVFKEQGLILAALLGLSAFFSMAETSITTLWPWKVCYCYLIYGFSMHYSQNFEWNLSYNVIVKFYCLCIEIFVLVLK